jgi:hypothetical protein
MELEVWTILLAEQGVNPKNYAHNAAGRTGTGFGRSGESKALLTGTTAISSGAPNAEVNQSRSRDHRENAHTCRNRENLPRLNFEFLVSDPDIAAFRRHHNVRMNEAGEACQ